ncbi:hypothetical protein AVEN_220344-1 [Araneus ventricosus]|uniref:Uncharacterized protein n=1 Tax=Araneus ventricosus TaxID=182803 RepID=A0A4Y2VTA7_ARAVE|nr:hypothetical protein AVEN_220344-1 [Araneus ventricosus]
MSRFRQVIHECSKVLFSDTLFEKAESPRLSPSHFLPPNALYTHTHTGDLSPALRNHISILWPSIPMDIKFGGIPTTLSICANFHRDFTLKKRFSFPCSVERMSSECPTFVAET